MCFKFNITEAWRERLGIFLGVLHVFLALFGMVLVFFSVYMKVRIETKMMLLETYNSGTLPYFLASIGCLMLIIHLFGAKVSFDISSEENREKFRNILMCLFVTICSLSIVVMAGGCVCFAHRGIIQQALKDGLYTTLKLYKTKGYIKEALDRLQMNFRCCGSQSYKDWFAVSWIDNQYIDLSNPAVKRHLVDGEYFSYSVPFSCCSVTSPYPCRHDDVRDNSTLTVYTEGCTGVLGEYFSQTVLVPAGNTVFVLFGFELLVLVMFRHLHTSIVSAEEEGDPEGVGEGYCVSGCPCFCCEGGDPNKYLKKRDRDAAREEEDFEEQEDYLAMPGGGDDGGGGAGGGRDPSQHRQGRDKGKNKNKKDKGKKDKKEKDKKKEKKLSKKEKKKTSPKKQSPKKSSPKQSKPKGKGGFGGKKGKRK